MTLLLVSRVVLSRVVVRSLKDEARLASEFRQLCGASLLGAWRSGLRTRNTKTTDSEACGTLHPRSTKFGKKDEQHINRTKWILCHFPACRYNSKRCEALRTTVSLGLGQQHSHFPRLSIGSRMLLCVMDSYFTFLHRSPPHMTGNLDKIGITSAIDCGISCDIQCLRIRNLERM